MSLLNRARNFAKSQGFVGLLYRIPSFLFKKSVRRIIPQRGYHYLNGVPWKEKKLTDSFTHPHWSDPEYEKALISAVREQVQNGDFVGVIGGGRGISTAVAAKRTGTTGKVTVYEASSHRIDWINRTLELNDIEDTVQTIHAVVGPAGNVYEDLGSAPTVSPEELPDFDVLEMDCEGAELKILNELTQQPRVIIVEVHPPEVAEKDVRSILQELNYEIVDQGWENENSDNPLPVLTAEHRRPC